MSCARVAIVGIDGSGKTTTALKLVRRLAGQMEICKPGRPSMRTSGGRTLTHQAASSRAMELMLRRADATGQRWRVALSRRRYLRFITGMEQQMVRRFAPELLLTARCPVLDPAVYAEFYLPTTARVLSLQARLSIAALASPVPPRDLYLFLDTPAKVAMARIMDRLEQLNAAREESGREHWLHLHERADVLARLSAQLRRGLELLRRRSGAGLLVVDNSRMRQNGVVELFAERVLALQRTPGRLTTARVAQQKPGSFPGEALGRTLPGEPAELLLPIPAPGRPQQLALIPTTAGALLLAASPAGGLLGFEVDLRRRVLLGPVQLSRRPCTRVVALDMPGAAARPEWWQVTDEQQSQWFQGQAWRREINGSRLWVLHDVRTARGAEVRLLRLGRLPFADGASQKFPAVELHGSTPPEPLSDSYVIRGRAASGAWDDRRSSALVVYVEPSRTELWALIFDARANVLVRPFALAAAEHQHLLDDTRVSWHTARACWLVCCRSTAAEGSTLTQQLEVQQDGALGRARQLPQGEAAFADQGQVLCQLRSGERELTVMARGQDVLLRVHPAPGNRGPAAAPAPD